MKIYFWAIRCAFSVLCGMTPLAQAQVPEAATTDSVGMATETSTSMTGQNTATSGTTVVAETSVMADSSTATQSASDESTTVTLAEGVEIRDLVVGTGPVASTTATRLIHYNMWLQDGRLINSSRTEMYPLPFKFTPGRGETIRGMEIGTDGMRVGGRRIIVIPPAAGYGAEGGGAVPPNETLTYEAELVGIL